MATETTTAAAAVLAAQGTVAAVAGASSPFVLHFADYGWASGFAVIGIVARHFWEASNAGRFNLKAMAFDLGTAPMLGIVAYIFALWFQIADYVVPLIVIVLGFLGPEWLRSLGDGIRSLVLTRIGGSGKSGG